MINNNLLCLVGAKLIFKTIFPVFPMFLPVRWHTETAVTADFSCEQLLQFASALLSISGSLISGHGRGAWPSSGRFA